jgi:hypothetical protein
MRPLKVLYVLAVIYLAFSSNLFGKQYVIYNISQQIPMGDENEKIEKSYFVNIGKVQGIKDGTVLDVKRRISKLNPMKTWKRHHFNVKIGELKVVHTENYSSICQKSSIEEDKMKGYGLDIEDFMLGDTTSPKINEK